MRVLMVVEEIIEKVVHIPKPKKQFRNKNISPLEQKIAKQEEALNELFVAHKKSAYSR